MAAAKYEAFAANIADNYGPYLTKAMKGSGETSSVDDLKSLFSSPTAVVLQSADGEEMLLTIGDDDNATMTWEEFQKVGSKDLEAQKFERTESACLGLLGNRIILEVARYNTDGEVYLLAYSLVEFNDDGKIVSFESFSDMQSASLIK